MKKTNSFFTILSVLISFNIAEASASMSEHAASQITGRFIAYSSANNDIVSFCSGILVSPKRVLTASHCLENASSFYTHGYTISFQLPGNEDPAISSKPFLVERSIQNKNFNMKDFSSGSYSTFISNVKYDFSFMDLKEAIPNQPAVSYFQGEKVPEGNILIYMGVNGSKGTLENLIVKVFKTDSDRDQVITVDTNGREGMVPGNSGGPLFMKTENGELSLVGLSSAYSTNAFFGDESYFVRYNQKRNQEMNLTKWNKLKKMIKF